mmetsp:Transcript_1150/g.2419  ORF Transcript_1150/g.2419 Transcript_1150/m.2419 type:complete len:101 (-) Transcript_1150:1320-1622(-)
MHKPITAPNILKLASSKRQPFLLQIGVLLGRIVGVNPLALRFGTVFVTEERTTARFIISVVCIIPVPFVSMFVAKATAQQSNQDTAMLVTSKKKSTCIGV